MNFPLNTVPFQGTCQFRGGNFSRAAILYWDNKALQINQVNQLSSSKTSYFSEWCLGSVKTTYLQMSVFRVSLGSTSPLTGNGLGNLSSTCCSWVKEDFSTFFLRFTCSKKLKEDQTFRTVFFFRQKSFPANFSKKPSRSDSRLVLGGTSFLHRISFKMILLNI